MINLKVYKLILIDFLTNKKNIYRNDLSMPLTYESDNVNFCNKSIYFLHKKSIFLTNYTLII